MSVIRRLCHTNSPLLAVPEDYDPTGRFETFEISLGQDAGKRIFYFDETIGGQVASHCVLFVHGNPESSYTYRYVIENLRSTTDRPLRIVAMDHIGFGLSDQASFEMVDMHHAANLIQLVRQLDLNHITLVVHDWGGPIGIGALLEDPERVVNLVVLNSTVFPIPDDGLTFKNYPIPWLPWHRMPDVVPDRWWGTIASQAVTTRPAGIMPLMGRFSFGMLRGGLGRISGKESAAERVWREQFASKINARSSKRNVRQTVVWGFGYTYDDPDLGRQDNRAFYRRIQTTILPAWGPQGRHIGVRALFGSWDPLAKDSVLSQWQTALPQLTGHIVRYEGMSHFIEEEKGPEIAAAIIELTQ